MAVAFVPCATAICCSAHNGSKWFTSVLRHQTCSALDLQQQKGDYSSRMELTGLSGALCPECMATKITFRNLFRALFSIGL